MQNKPNFKDAQMNVNLYVTMDYENKHNRTLGQNKPNQSQFLLSSKAKNEIKIACRKIWPHHLNIKNLLFCWEYCLWLL